MGLALPLIACALAALAGCSKKAVPESSTQDTPLADIAMVAAEDETSFTDLPGVDGFDGLSPSLQAAVVARANRARCDCGCPGHSVNACLHQEESCDVALGLARGFVADAQALALNAPELGETAAPSGETPAPSGEIPAPSGETPAPSGEIPAPSGEIPAPSGETPTAPVVKPEMPATAGEGPPAPAGAPDQTPSGASAPDAPAASGR